MKATPHLILLVFFGFNALSLGAKAPYFVHTRADKNLPAHCVPFQFSYFDELPLEGAELEARTLYVGIDGAHRKGFTHQYDMERGQASVLWNFLKRYVPAGGSFEGMAEAWTRENAARADFAAVNAHFTNLAAYAESGGWDFKKEGDVLEALVPYAVSKGDEENCPEALRETYPESEYFITGGLEYHSETGATVGELDVVVGNRQDCKVVAIGEAKLGLRSLTKARQQLARFVGFLKNLRERQ